MQQPEKDQLSGKMAAVPCTSAETFAPGLKVAVAPARYEMDPETGKTKAGRERIGSFATAREAKDALEMFRRFPTTKVNITFAGVYEEWSEIAYRSISKQTRDNYYTASYAKFASLYGETFRELRTGQYQSIIDYYAEPFPAIKKDGSAKLDNDGRPIMSKPLSFSSLSKMKALLTQMYTYALQNDIVHKNYATFLTLPKHEKTVKDCFNEQELQKIEAAIGRVAHADSILLMCYTGFRISEFLELKPENYDAKNHVLTGGKKTAAGRNRLVPVHRRVQHILDEKLAMGGQTIICDENGKPYTQDNFRRRCYYPALDAIGVRCLTPHATRHSFATRAIENNMPPKTLQKIMGHAKLELTMDLYVHVTDETLERDMRRLEGISVRSTSNCIPKAYTG